MLAAFMSDCVNLPPSLPSAAPSRGPLAASKVCVLYSVRKKSLPADVSSTLHKLAMTSSAVALTVGVHRMLPLSRERAGAEKEASKMSVILSPFVCDNARIMENMDRSDMPDM